MRAGYCFGFFNLDGFVPDVADSEGFMRQLKPARSERWSTLDSMRIKTERFGPSG
jgi:hypothetical protein